VELKLLGARLIGVRVKGVKGQNSERGIETIFLESIIFSFCPVSKARIPSVELKPGAAPAGAGQEIGVKGQNSERGIETFSGRLQQPVPPWCQRPEFRAWN